MSDFGRVQVGHPVDVGSGAVFTLMEDFVLPGTVNLAWSRFYSTDIEANGCLGRGWVVPWFMRLERVADGYLLIDEHGRQLMFSLDKGVDLPVGGRVISYGANMELVRHDDHFAVEHWHHGTDDVEQFCFPFTGTALMPLGSLVNLFGHSTRIEHDSLGKPVRLLQEIEQRSIELIYRRDDLLESVVLRLDDGTRKRLVRYEYDEKRHLILAFDAMDHRTSYQYDEQHRMIRETNALGSSFHFSYDAEGRCVHTFGDGGYQDRKLRYSTAQRTTWVTDSFGNVTRYLLNAAGQVVQEVSPLGATTTTEYDEFGRPMSIMNPLGGILRYEYDVGGNRGTVVHEDGGRTEMAYNDVHLLHKYTSPSGAIWTYDFNTRSQTVGLTNPLGDHHTFTRDGRGLVVETRSPTGRLVKRSYGRALRWVEAFDEISLLTRTEYDESGNQTAVFDSEGLVQRITYDPLGRPLVTKDRIGRTYHTSWNALGELVELSGPDVPWERRTYDGFGQLVEHANPAGVLRIDYDSEGRITRIVNRTNEELRWTYDADGWLVTETGFDGRIERYEYDLCGRPIRLIKADGRSISQVFDSCGAVVRRVSLEGDIEEFDYDRDGSLVKAKNRVSEVLLERNQAGRVIAEVQNGRRIEYACDADGDRTGRRIIGINSATLRFKRDARKRMISLEDDSGVCVELRWDYVNRIIERNFAGSVAERFNYDSVGRLREQSVRSAHSSAQIERHYEYDSADNLVARQDWKHGGSAYGYDEIGRLVSVATGSRIVEHYSYDANGAILETHRGRRVLAKGGRTLEEGPRHYTYGRDGALQKIEATDGAITLLEHNIDGQITKAVLPDGREARYEYDPLGRRVAKDVGGLRTEFIWEGPVLAAECRIGEPTESYYVFGFEPLVQWHGQRRLLPVKDQSGLVREVLDERGALLWDGRFEAYGVLLTESGLQRNPFRLRGQYCDNETELYHNFNRTYSPVLSDYTSPDPIGIEGGTNFYAYPRNPLLWDDPFGLKCGTSACGEKSMDGFFGQKGYKKVSVRGKNPNANGIDAIYYKKGGKPPYIIAESKNRGGYNHPDQHGNAQQSDAWINRAPGNASGDRLQRALPPGSPHLADIHAAAGKGDVGVVVYNREKEPKVTNYGTYGGPTSTNPSEPPKGSGPF